MKKLLQWSIASVLLCSVAACGSAPTPTSSNDAAPTPSENPAVATKPSETPNGTTPEPTAPSSDTPDPVEASPTPANSPVVATPANPIPSPTPQQIAAANQTREITLYKLDNQCENFVEQKVNVPRSNTTNSVVGKVIENSNSPDFKIDNYRISVNNGTATVDLRLPPDAKRPFTAMSTCEQRSLLGSMQKTLTSNPDLKINSVRFTDGKEELIF